MTLTQLKYFCEVAKTRHFTAAANNLFVAQSSLSHAIRELEQELDAPLFIRRPNKQIDLTSYGKTLLSYAEAGIKMLEDGKNEVVSMQSPLHGKVKLGFFFSIAFNVIPHLIQGFKEANPDVEIELATAVYHNWTDLREVLLQGQCDMVISAGHICADCESIEIGRHRIVLTVPKGHQLEGREEVSLQEIKDETLLAIDANSNMDTVIKNMFKEEKITPHMKYVSDWTAQQLAVLAGNGLALSTDVPVNTEHFSKVKLQSPRSIMPLYLTWPSNRRMSQSALYVKDFLMEFSEKEMKKVIF